MEPIQVLFDHFLLDKERLILHHLAWPEERIAISKQGWEIAIKWKNWSLGVPELDQVLRIWFPNLILIIDYFY
jgi:hypothetical protein